MALRNTFKTITSTADPSIDSHAFFKTTSLLLQPWNWRNSNKLSESEERFAKYFSFGNAFGFNRGRESLFALLKALNIKEGDEVVIQAFTCEALIAGILWTGATPVYADIDENFNLTPESVKKVLTPKTKALVVQHTFGLPAEINKLSKICKETEIHLIEDIAHALGARDPETANYLGSFSIASFTSFGQDKKISAQGGGMLFTNDNELAAKIREFQSQLGFIPTWTVLKKLIKTKIFFFAIRLYHFANLGKLLIFLARKLGLAGRPVEKVASETLEKLSDSDIKKYVKRLHPLQASLAASQLKHFEEHERHRKEITRIYMENIKVGEKSKYGGPLLRFPLLLEPEEKAKAFKSLKAIRVLAGEWYPEPVLRFGTPWETLKYQLGSCKNAERMNKLIVNLPTHKLVSEKDALNIAIIINQTNAKA